MFQHGTVIAEKTFRSGIRSSQPVGLIGRETPTKSDPKILCCQIWNVPVLNWNVLIGGVEWTGFLLVQVQSLPNTC
jgi:hypothetical protein